MAFGVPDLLGAGDIVVVEGGGEVGGSRLYNGDKGWTVDYGYRVAKVRISRRRRWAEWTEAIIEALEL